MHIAQSKFVRGEVTITTDYRTNDGQRRVTLIFSGDDIGLRDTEDVGLPARDQALKLLSDFVGTAVGDLKAKRIRWRGI